MSGEGKHLVIAAVIGGIFTLVAAFIYGVISVYGPSILVEFDKTDHIEQVDDQPEIVEDNGERLENERS